MARLVTKNWAEFQHYKDRSPPWIKLHKELLDDRKFQSLPLASRALAPMLWLLASESKDGSFDSDPEELAFRLRTTVKEITAGLEPLIRNGFFYAEQGASNPLAEYLQVAVPETERETEAKTEKKKNAALAPIGVSDSVWEDFLRVRKAKKAPMTNTALAGIIREAEKAGYTLEQALMTCCARGWQSFKAEWVAQAPIQTFAQAKADVVKVTVPENPDYEATQARLRAEASRPIAKPSEAVLARLEAIRSQSKVLQ